MYVTMFVCLFLCFICQPEMVKKDEFRNDVFTITIYIYVYK